MLTYRISTKDHCRQAESFLHSLLPTATRGYLQKILKSGHLQRGGTPLTPEQLLLLDDEVTLKESSKTTAMLGRTAPAVDILYEDDMILLVNKEPGRSLHNTAEDTGKDLVIHCQEYLERRGTPCKLRPVNRIDRGTSGAVILAKSPTAAGIMGRFVRETGLGKVYLAVVSGELAESGEIDLPLEGKESLTRYQRLYQGEEAAVAAVFPVTGRTHQIRKHFSLSGRPIIGDRRYGGITFKGLGGHALHAFSTTFPHPATEEELTIYAPLPPGMLALLESVCTRDFKALLMGLAEIRPSVA